MAFRPPRPTPTHGWSSRHWANWLNDQGVIHTVRALETRTCRLCSAPTRVGPLGGAYPHCYNCGFVFREYLRRVVPISYSTSHGLTSLIAQAKDDPERDWLHKAFASLLFDFLRRHWSCLETAFGGPIDALTTVPSHPSSRGGRDHLHRIPQSIRTWHGLPPWDLGVLTKLRADSADDHRRVLVPDLFAVSPGQTVRGKRILLIDDLCTSGSTIASAAHALTEAGAHRPVAVTLGRHIRHEDLHAQDLLHELRGRGWERGDCAVHPPGEQDRP